MILRHSLFKAKLFEHPKIEDEETKELKKFGKFTVGKEYEVLAIFDNVEKTDFLVTDDSGEFWWLNMKIFRK